jgi:hypothetical protein
MIQLTLPQTEIVPIEFLMDYHLAYFIINSPLARHLAPVLCH